MLFWDASAKVKRYIPEQGSYTVDELYSESGQTRMVSTLVGYAEAYAILLRRKNVGALSLHEFRLARASLEFEVVQSGRFELLTIENDTIFASLALIDRHNLNSTDAAVLAAFLQHRNLLPANSAPCVLVASDKRMLRAAAAEGLTILDPEALTPSDVAGFLNGL